MQTLFGTPEKREGLFSKLKSAVSSTKANLVARIEEVISGKREIDATLLDELESVLIGADVGLQTSTEILGSDANFPGDGSNAHDDEDKQNQCLDRHF